jgi:hypothetical protein
MDLFVLQASGPAGQVVESQVERVQHGAPDCRNVGMRAA